MENYEKLGGYGTAAVCVSVPPFEQISSTLNRAQELAIRVEHLASRIAGSYPSAAGTMSNEPKVDGAVPLLCAQAERTDTTLSNAHEALNRLERLLP